MKKIFYSFIFLLTFILSTPVLAQSTYHIYVHDISLNQTEYNVGDTVTGNFKLSNLSETPQSDIYYVISSGSYDIDTMLVSGTLGMTDKLGPQYVKGMSKDSIDFSYKLPSSLRGSSAIQITAMLKDGTLVGQSELPIIIEGDLIKETAFVLGSYLNISELDQKIPPQTGPVVYENETIEYNFFLSSTTQKYTVKPILKLYDRVDNTDSLKRTIELDPIETNGGKEPYSINLPVDLEPLVYYGIISFESDKVEISPVDLRYIISGPIATIRNITTDSLKVKTGNTFSALISYGGQPFDQFRSDKQSQSVQSKLEVKVVNEKGELVAQQTTDLNLDDPIKEKQLFFTAENSGASLSFEAVIKTLDGKVLDEYKTNMPNEESVKNQVSYEANETITWMSVLGIALLIIVLLLILFLKKKYSTSDPVVSLPTVVVLLGLTLLPSSVFASTAPSWEEISKVGAMFTVTSVSSPLPPDIKSYAPGERFNLKFNLNITNCNNVPSAATVWVSKDQTNWVDIQTVVGYGYIAPNSSLWNKNLLNYLNGLIEPSYWLSDSETAYTNTLLERYLHYKSGVASVGDFQFSLVDFWGTGQYMITDVSFKDSVLSNNFNSDPAVISAVNGLNAILAGGFGAMNGVKYLYYGSEPKNIGSVMAHGNFLYSLSYSYPFTATTTPGLHKVYFKAVGYGNGGNESYVAAQNYCVIGAGVCPGEATVISLSATADNITSTSAKINWTYVDVKPQTEYKVEISKYQDFPAGDLSTGGTMEITGLNRAVSSKVAQNSILNTILSFIQRYDFLVSIVNAQATIADLKDVTATGLEPATKYYAKVSVYNGEKWTTENVSFTTIVDIPQKPTLYLDSKTCNSALLSWSTVVGETYYVYKNGVELVGSVTPSFNATGLTENTEYTFKLKAKKGTEEVFSDDIVVTTGWCPARCSSPAFTCYPGTPTGQINDDPISFLWMCSYHGTTDSCSLPKSFTPSPKIKFVLSPKIRPNCKFTLDADDVQECTVMKGTESVFPTYPAAANKKVKVTLTSLPNAGVYHTSCLDKDNVRIVSNPQTCIAELNTIQD